MENINSERVNKNREPQRVILDIRTPEEFNQRHKADAINLPLSLIEEGRIEKISHLSMTTPIGCYCNFGGRAQRASDALVKLGYSDVVNLGGIDDF